MPEYYMSPYFPMQWGTENGRQMTFGGFNLGFHNPFFFNPFFFNPFFFNPFFFNPFFFHQPFFHRGPDGFGGFTGSSY